MQTKYMVLNPENGEYESFETEGEAKLSLAKRAIAFYISHSHGIAYNKVTIDENGWETWESQNAINLMDEGEVETLIASLM